METDINQILKQATALKRTYGYSAEIDFLIESYNPNKQEELPQLLNKIYVYFKRDIHNAEVNRFIAQLINSRTIQRFPGILPSYYWLLKDYESYKQTIMNQIANLNINNPWQFCYDQKQLLNSLCDYYCIMGLENKYHASMYLHHLISSIYFDVAGELIVYSRNFPKLYYYLHFSRKLEFYHPDRLIPISESIKTYFDGGSADGSKCLKSLHCAIPYEKFVQIIKQKIFSDFPQLLGFKIDILDRMYSDTKSFFFTFFDEEDYKDIHVLTDKIREWETEVAENSVSIIAKGTGSILELLYTT